MNRFSKFLDIHRYDIHREFIDWTTNTSALLTIAVAWRQESSSRKVSGNRLNQMSASKYKSNRQSNARNIQDSIDDNHDVVWEQLTLFIHVYHTCSIIPNLMSRCGRKGLTRYYCEMEKLDQGEGIFALPKVGTNRSSDACSLIDHSFAILLVNDFQCSYIMGVFNMLMIMLQVAALLSNICLYLPCVYWVYWIILLLFRYTSVETTSRYIILYTFGI